MMQTIILLTIVEYWLSVLDNLEKIAQRKNDAHKT